MAAALVIGIVTGGIYGLFAVGVVLVYRGTGALNFAQGEIGTASLFVAYFLITVHHLPWIVGAAGAMAVAAALGIGFEMAVVRRMVNATRVSVAVATVGLLLFILAVEVRFFSASPRSIVAPIQGVGVKIFGYYVSPTQFLSLIAVLALGLGLSQALRRTDFGLGVLAASHDPVTVRLVGVPAGRVAAFVWGSGAAVSALGALLILPAVGGFFVPGFASELFLRGLAAAVVGGLTNLPGAFVGGIVVGVVEAESGHLFGSSGLPGVKPLTVLILLLAVLLVRPSGIFGGSKTAAAEVSA